MESENDVLVLHLKDGFGCLVFTIIATMNVAFFAASGSRKFLILAAQNLQL